MRFQDESPCSCCCRIGRSKQAKPKPDSLSVDFDRKPPPRSDSGKDNLACRIDFVTCRITQFHYQNSTVEDCINNLFRNRNSKTVEAIPGLLGVYETCSSTWLILSRAIFSKRPFQMIVLSKSKCAPPIGNRNRSKINIWILTKQIGRGDYPAIALLGSGLTHEPANESRSNS